MRTINSFIEPSILKKTQEIQLLSRSIHSRLPSKFHAHCWLIDIKDHLALIVADSADIATALRYQQHELLKQINEEFAAQLITPIKRVKIKVITPQHTSSHAQKPLHTPNHELSKRYCRHILDTLNNSDN